MAHREMCEGSYQYESQNKGSIRLTSGEVSISLRQLEIVVPFSQGKSLVEVSKGLSISPTTANKHVDQAYVQNKLEGNDKKGALTNLLYEKGLLNDLTVLGLQNVLREMWQEVPTGIVSYEYNGKTFVVELNDSHPQVRTDDFIATVPQLRVLSMMRKTTLHVAGIVIPNGIVKIPRTGLTGDMYYATGGVDRGLSPAQNRERVKMPRTTWSGSLQRLKESNEKLTGKRSSRQELLCLAETYGLLDEVTQEGLRVLAQSTKECSVKKQ